MRRPGAHALLTLAAIVAALSWSLCLALPHLRGEASFLDRIEAPLTDLRFLIAGPRPAPEDVAVVAIDDDTVQAAGGYPLPRAYMAKLVRGLAQGRPKVLAFDVLFVDPGNPDIDDDLAAALASAPAVLGMAATFARSGQETRADYGPYQGIPVAERLLQPFERLRQAAKPGLVNVATDHGGTPRHIPLLVAAEGSLHPSLTLRAASLAAGASPELLADAVKLGPQAVPVDLGASLALRFYGPQGSIRTLSARAVVEGTAPAQALAGRAVVIGATVLGGGDTFAIPFDPVLPGVEVLATGVSHLLHGDALVRTGTIRRIDAGAALALPVLVLLLLSARRVGIGLALAGALMTLLAIVAFLLFGRGVWLSLSLPLAAVLVPLVPYVGARLWLDRRQERRLEAARESLLRFHPPAVAARLEAQPDFLEAPVEQRAAVLFLDLSGFTGLSERLGPVRTQALLKEMHDLVEEEATARDGSVTSFMGDGAMVLFGLPDAQADDPDRAVATALALAQTLPAWLERRVGAKERGSARLGVRIGANAGPVVLSRLGGARNQHITATGDTVNVTSRLLEIAKTEGAPVVFTTDLLRLMRRPFPPDVAAMVKQVPVRGRAEPLDICVVPDPASLCAAERGAA